MICDNCKRENRREARFCKWCGTSLPVNMDALDRLVGMETVKKQIMSILETHLSLRARPETMNISVNTNILIVGDSGTGKSLLGRVLKDLFHANDIIKKPILRILNAGELSQHLNEIEKDISNLKGGILLIEEADKLLSGTSPGVYTLLDKLFLEMGYWNNDPIIIMTALPGTFDTYLTENPVAYNRLRYIFQLNSYSIKELAEICVKQLNDELGGIQISEEAYDALIELFINDADVNGNVPGNGHYTQKKAEEIYSRYLTREKKVKGIILPEDIRN